MKSILFEKMNKIKGKKRDAMLCYNLTLSYMPQEIIVTCMLCLVFPGVPRCPLFVPSALPTVLLVLFPAAGPSQ